MSLLNCEDELLAVAGAVEIANFPEASRAVARGPYDVSLVEGSLTTPHDIVRIQKVRRISKFLITIGACATAGGIQSLHNYQNVADFTRIVYANPEYIETLAKSTPIADHIFVDFELRGCPIDKYQLLETVNALLNNRKPNIPKYSLCIDCKRKGNVCVMVSQGIPCMGPVTQTGCGALCPSYNRGCFSCFGPKETPNTIAMSDAFGDLGVKEDDIIRFYRTFNAYAEPFRKESEAYER